MRKKKYVSSYKLEYLEVYKYISLLFVEISTKQQQSLTLSRRIYEHQYIYAKIQAFVNRLCNSYVKIIDKIDI